MSVSPHAPRPGEPVTLHFRIASPKLQLIHEKLLRLFVVSRDLTVFRHEHPELMPDGSFVHRIVLPEGGMYRLLCDFYPEGGTPQMAAKTLFLTGPDQGPQLRPDLRPVTAGNVRVSLRLDPEKPLAGRRRCCFLTSIPPPDSSILCPWVICWP